MKSTCALDTRRFWIPVSRPKGMGISGCGSTLAASTSEGVQSHQFHGIASIKTRRYAMHTSTMYMAPLFLAGKTTKCVPSRTAGPSVVVRIEFTRDDGPKQCLFLQQGLTIWEQEDAGTHFRRYHFSDNICSRMELSETGLALLKSCCGLPMGRR